MLARTLARLSVLGSLALLAAAPAVAQTPQGSDGAPGVAFSRAFGPGWLSLVVAHPDGGFVAAGRRFVPGDGGTGIVGLDWHHPVVVRLGPDGGVRWEKAFANRYRGEPQTVQVVPGAGIRLTGSAGLSFDKPGIRRLDWVAEIDAEGRVTRDDGLDLDRPKHDGRFLPLTASTFAFYGSANLETGEPGIDILATDARGSLLWRARMPDVAGECEGAATADPEGSLAAVVGTASPDLTPNGARFRRFDAGGKMSDDRPLGAFKDACPMAIRRVPGAGFVVTGWRSEAEGPTGWVALLNADGSLVWERLFGPAEKAVTAGYDATPASDGGLVVAGCIDGATPEGVVLRYGPAGDLTAERRLASESGIAPVAVQVAADGSTVLAGVLDQRCGRISGKDGGGTAWVTSLAPDALTAPAR